MLAARLAHGALLFVLLTAPRWARAEATPLDAGIRAYESFDYERAEALLRTARSESLTVPERVRADVYLGLIHFTLGKRDAATSDFKHALEADRAVQLPSDTSPKIFARFEELRAQLPPAPPSAKVDLALTATETTPPARPGRLWTWVAAGTSVAALAAGTTFQLLANHANADIPSATSYDDADELASRAHGRGMAAKVLFVGGGVAAVAAVVLWFVEAPPHTEVTANGVAVHF